MFAEMVLGSVLFSQHYGLVPLLNIESMLEALDEPLLDADGRKVVLMHKCCIFTARPSLPPGHLWHPRQQGDDGALVHPPEAEIGLKLLQLEHLPMIALGHVQWLADRFNERVYDLTKPGPVQALAAILTASGINEKTALLAAFHLWKEDIFAPEFHRVHGEHIYVLEDNAAGVLACHSASALLKRNGINVTIHGLGISKAEAKRTALRPICESLFEEPNAALISISTS